MQCRLIVCNWIRYSHDALCSARRWINCRLLSVDETPESQWNKFWFSSARCRVTSTPQRPHLFSGSYVKNIVAAVRIRWRCEENGFCQKLLRNLSSIWDHVHVIACLVSLIKKKCKCRNLFLLMNYVTWMDARVHARLVLLTVEQGDRAGSWYGCAMRTLVEN